jgi:DNA-3-methyladenine glycosylase
MVDSGKLPLSFYERDNVVEVAKDLLGKILYSSIDGTMVAGRIVETEAYSFLERACHAHLNRRTRRTETLFAPGGTAYVYLCYGIHHLFNVVTNTQGTAEAVLIRALEPVTGLPVMQQRRGMTERTKLTSGPGKLSQALGITTGNNGVELTGSDIWISHGEPVKQEDIVTDVRIGVDYAGEDALLPWRFLVKGNRFVSVPPKSCDN